MLLILVFRLPSKGEHTTNTYILQYMQYKTENIAPICSWIAFMYFVDGQIPVDLSEQDFCEMFDCFNEIHY